MNNICLKITVALIAGLAFSANANAVTRTVDCDKGQTIQAALDKGQGSSGPLVINVSGLCEENASIRRDDVTINGNNSSTVSGTISLQGASRTRIENITVTGPGHAIAASGSNNVDLNNVIATGNDGFAAIFAVSNSSLNINNSNISSNVGDGIFVGLNTSLVTSADTVINNTVIGVHVTIGSSAFIQDGTLIQGNQYGIFVDKHSIVDLENADVSNNTNFGIVISRDSAATLRTGNTITGNAYNNGVICSDTESSYSNDGVPIADNVYCTDFDQVAPEPE